MMNMENIRNQFHTTVENLGKLIPMEGLKSQALNVVNILREKLDLIIEKFSGINPIDILKTHLMDAHHPYGLLLSSAPLVSGPAGGIDASGMSSISSLSGSVQKSSGLDYVPSANLLRNMSVAAFSGLSSSAHSPEASLISTGLTLSSMGTKVGEDGQAIRSGEPLFGALSSVLGLAAGSEPAIGQIVQQSFAVGPAHTEAMMLPLMMSVGKEEQKHVIEKPIEVTANKLRVGAVVANVFVYYGSKPYIVEGNGMAQATVVRKGDKILTLHVNHTDKDDKLKKLDPIARSKAIKRDFQGLCNLLETPNKYGLTEDQIGYVKALDKAPIIGVSHLVRLITTKGLPAWTINSLPRVLQQFHTLDSQAVSNQFGGNRKVDKKDIGVMFLPANMRSLVY